MNELADRLNYFLDFWGKRSARHALSQFERKLLNPHWSIQVDDILRGLARLRKKLQAEIERHKRFSVGILGGKKEDYFVKDVDIRNYAKYLLREGNIFEKRDLLSCLKSSFCLKDKLLSVRL